MKPKVYRLRAAIELVAAHGYTDCPMPEEHLKANPLVRVKQDWWPSGREVARFIKARGKYRGNSIGCALRPKE